MSCRLLLAACWALPACLSEDLRPLPLELPPLPSLPPRRPLPSQSGRIVFQGPPATAVAVFAKAGFPCPELTNPAGGWVARDAASCLPTALACSALWAVCPHPLPTPPFLPPSPSPCLQTT